MNGTASDLLELHSRNAEALRHTSGVIWQFAIAIVTLQGGALALAAQAGLKESIGRYILVGGFLLAVLFSMMLVRQAKERQGFVTRILAIEAELRKTHPAFFTPIPRAIGWFTRPCSLGYCSLSPQSAVYYRCCMRADERALRLTKRCSQPLTDVRLHFFMTKTPSFKAELGSASGD